MKDNVSFIHNIVLMYTEVLEQINVRIEVERFVGLGRADGMVSPLGGKRKDPTAEKG